MGRFSFLVVSSVTIAAAAANNEAKTCSVTAALEQASPYVNVPPNTWLPQSVVSTEDLKSPQTWKAVNVCCKPTTPLVVTASSSPRQLAATSLQTVEIGKMPQFSTDTALGVLDEAVAAWKGGMGKWTSELSLDDRMKRIELFLVELAKSRDDIIDVLMWEIGKNYDDAASEFDRTVAFCRQVMDTIRDDPEFSATSWQDFGATKALVRRAAVGIILCLGPYNYPLNETYAALIPALLMGNVCILKIPTVGGLVHLLTMEAFRKALEGTGAIHFIAGSGRATMPPLMKTGKIDGLAFVGGSEAADDLISKHPTPHRLKVFLQLEANNMGIYLDNLFEKKHAAVLEHALDQAVVGSLSYNGQRCTALKLHMVPSAHAESFANMLSARVEALTVGLPWQQHAGVGDKMAYSQITPLPNQKRIEYMQALLEDALAKGAKILNPKGGSLVGGENSTLMVPSVLYPVTPDMRVFEEEQFGPLVPVATYDNVLEDVLPLARDGAYAQQVSLFSATTSPDVTALVDAMAAVFARINLNTQCGRSPDTLPFAGRRSSAMGTMSVSSALREFSVPTVLSYKENGRSQEANQGLVQELGQSTQFLKPVS